MIEPTGADRTAVPARAAETAAGHFTANYNCAESVLRGLNETLHLDLPAEAHAIATPFGGGFGGAGSCCGALTGSLMAIGLARGRSVPTQPAAPAATAARAVHDRFVERFGTACCRELTGGFQQGQPERRQFCTALVRFAAETAATILVTPDTDPTP